MKTLQDYIDKLNKLNFKDMYEGDFFLTWEKTDDELEAVFTVADALRYMIRRLPRFAKPKRAGLSILNFPGRGRIVPEPYGQILVFATWNYPLLLALEPAAGALMILMASKVEPVLPYLLSFTAGAMLYVVVEELIPEANLSQGGHSGTLGVMAGFLLMMILDVALG